MIRSETALRYFDEGCDCGKALLKTYEPVLILNEHERKQYQAPCNQLPGKPAERCEVVSAAHTILEHLGAERSIQSKKLQEHFEARFNSIYTSTSCKKLLGYDLGELHDFSEALDTDAVNKVCRNLLQEVCSILDDLIQE